MLLCGVVGVSCSTPVMASYRHASWNGYRGIFTPQSVFLITSDSGQTHPRQRQPYARRDKLVAFSQTMYTTIYVSALGIVSVLDIDGRLYVQSVTLALRIFSYSTIWGFSTVVRPWPGDIPRQWLTLLSNTWDTSQIRLLCGQLNPNPEEDGGTRVDRVFQGWNGRSIGLNSGSFM